MAAGADIEKALKSAQAELDGHINSNTQDSRFEGEVADVIDSREIAVLQTVVARLQEALGAYERLDESTGEEA